MHVQVQGYALSGVCCTVNIELPGAYFRVTNLLLKGSSPVQDSIEMRNVIRPINNSCTCAIRFQSSHTLAKSLAQLNVRLLPYFFDFFLKAVW
jgi:hypothetical protein